MDMKWVSPSNMVWAQKFSVKLQTAEFLVLSQLYT
jgi:hypothetical protein